MTPDPVGSQWDLQNAFNAAALGAIIVALIYFGQPILMPAALAVLLAFALGPVVARLRVFGLGHATSAILTVLLAFLIIGAVGTYIVGEFAHLAEALPSYRTNLLHKVDSIRGAAEGNGFVSRMSSMLTQFENDFSAGSGAAQPAPSTPSAEQNAMRPVPVIIRQTEAAPLDLIQRLIGPLLDPLATIGIVIVFVIFILLQKEDLRDRFIRLAGTRDLRRTAMALDDAANRLSRYLLLQTSINAGFGFVIGGGLAIIGIPNAGLWGLIAMMFRFVPYIGVPAAALFPVALAIAVDPGWSKVVWTIGLYLAIEPVLGQFVEPVVYGRSIGLSATAIFVSATFWTWVWGPIGLLLSTPLTMCLVVVGKHVDHLRFLDIVFGDRPPLEQEESLYLRMLGGDPDDAALQAEAFLKTNSLAVYYDDVVIKALALAQADVQRGALDRERRHNIRVTLEGLIENLTEREESKTQAPQSRGAEPLQPVVEDDIAEEWRGQPVLCVAGRNSLDEAAAVLLIDLLRRKGIGARVVSNDEALPMNIHRLDDSGARLFCLSYLEPANYANARYLLGRLHRRFPGACPMIGFWGPHDDSTYLDAVEETQCNLIATTLHKAVEQIVALARHAPAPPAEQPAPLPVPGGTKVA